MSDPLARAIPQPTASRRVLGINLASDLAPTEWLRVKSEVTSLSVDVIPTSGTTWGSSTVKIQSTLSIEKADDGRSLENARDFPTGTNLSTTTPSRRNVSVTNAGWIRFICTGSDGSGDPDARVVVSLQ